MWANSSRKGAVTPCRMNVSTPFFYRLKLDISLGREPAYDDNSQRQPPISSLQKYVTMPTKQWIGIDVSQASLKIACPAPGGKWSIGTIANTTLAISRWVKSVDAAAVQVVLESTGTYSSKLAHVLHHQGIAFSVVTPRQASQFGGVLKNISKTDERDACCLSLFGQHMQPPLYDMPSAQAERLKQLRALLRQLKKQRHALKNQLHALQQHAQPAPEALDVIGQTIDYLGGQIESVAKQIGTVGDAAFGQLLKQVCTVKGIGLKTAMALLVATDGLKHFTDVKQVAKFVGLAPRLCYSGTLAPKAHINRAADPELRTLFYLATWSACKSNKACIELRKKLKNKGKAPKVILIAVAHKLLRQVWGVVKNNAPFDNDFETKNNRAA